MGKPKKTAFKSASFLLAVLGSFLFQPVFAQNGAPKSFSWQLGAGSAYVYDDYLSPLSHDGLSLLFSSGNMKPLKWDMPSNVSVNFNNAKWFSQSSFYLNALFSQSTGNSTIAHGNIDLRFSILRQFLSKQDWSLSAGGFTSLNGGGRYCLQNGNNPGSIDAFAEMGASVFTDYDFLLLNKNMKLTYQGSFSLIGAGFSPEYAESYYEIFYLGNTKNTAQFAHPFNYQHWRQQLSLDIPLTHRKSSLRLSYWNEGRISLFNDIRTRIYTSHFSAGYIRYFNVL
jgi:hypothetical protein